MIFNSFQFIWLFPLIFIVYWVTHRFFNSKSKIPLYLLLVVSYGVYMQWNPGFGLVILGVSLVTYFYAIALEKYRDKRKLLIWSGSLLALLPLLIFKYFNFVTDAGASALQWIGIDVAPRGLTWVVPLGLSFYTFQVLGYLFDVYRQKVEAERNLPTYLLFVSFFPQILCGPINTASSLLPQLRNLPSFNYSLAVSGLRMILWGMFMKVVVADRLGLYVDTIFEDYTLFSGKSALLAAIFYSIQIYCDFAGYSYIAVGVARLLGIELIVNFRRPYFAQSVSEFWRRWNISLTRWLTANVFIPLGGSRRGKLRNYCNIIITFLVSGIWHGANFTFIFWGLLHGVAQSIEKFFGLNRRESFGLVRVLRMGVTFAFVTLAWIYFRSPSIGYANEFIFHILSPEGSFYVDAQVFMHLAIGLFIVFAVESAMELDRGAFTRFLGRHNALRWTGYVMLTILIVGFGVLDASQFIYVKF